jgi:hypothetical protein
MRWRDDDHSMLRLDGLEISERIEQNRRVSIGFSTSAQTLTMDEWRHLWNLFVPHPPWDEDRVRRSIAHTANPHFRFVTTTPLVKVAALVDSVVTIRTIAPQPEIVSDHLTSRLAALELRILELENRVAELESGDV